MAPNRASRFARVLNRLNAATAAFGKKSELARLLGVTPQQLNDWLAGRYEPGAEVTIQLLEWVSAEEAKQETLGSARNTTKGKRTRLRKAKHANLKTGPP